MGRRRREKMDGEKENEAEGVVLIETYLGVWSFLSQPLRWQHGKH